MIEKKDLLEFDLIKNEWKELNFTTSVNSEVSFNGGSRNIIGFKKEEKIKFFVKGKGNSNFFI
jgi:hypothetical protein